MSVGGLRPVGSWLERFRRAAAVPAAVGDDLEAELMPVFAALAELEREAEGLRAAAVHDGERRRAAAAAEAERILVEARRNAAAERARAEEERRCAATSEAAAIEAAGRAEAERVAARGRERLPALVADVVRSLDGRA